MSVYDKLHELKHTLVGDEHDSTTGAEDSGRQEEEHRESLSHKIKDVLDGGEARKKREEEEERLRIEKEKEDARRIVEAQRGLGGKIHDALDGGKHRAELEQSEFERLEAQAQEDRKKHADIKGKLHDVLDLEAPSELHEKVQELRLGPEKAEEKESEDQHHLSNKVKELWNSAPAEENREQKEHHKLWESKGSEEQQERDDGWREKLRALSGSPNKVEKKKVERSWLMEKLNGMAGGGAKGEEKEDQLDKTIDFIQEHILRQGTQSNETALEQMKDEQIGLAIRTAYKQVTGHELPSKNKK